MQYFKTKRGGGTKPLKQHPGIKRGTVGKRPRASGPRHVTPKPKTQDWGFGSWETPKRAPKPGQGAQRLQGIKPKHTTVTKKQAAGVAVAVGVGGIGVSRVAKRRRMQKEMQRQHVNNHRTLDRNYNDSGRRKY